MTTENVIVAPKESSTAGIVGFILSIVGIFLFAFPCGLAAFICGIVGCKDKTKKQGLATAAIVIGSIEMVLGGLTILAASMGMRLF